MSMILTPSKKTNPWAICREALAS